MKKGLKYVGFILAFIYIFIMLMIIPSLELGTNSNTVTVTEYNSNNIISYNYSGQATLVAHVSAIPQVAVPDPVVVKPAAKVVTQQPKVQVQKAPAVQAQKAPAAPATPAPNIEDQFNLGTITISNSDFFRKFIMDDGSYYYLNHDLYGTYNNVGMPIVDSRTNFKTKKTIIYAHSAKNGRSPFNYLQNYHNNPGFFNAHRYITITYEGHTYKYEIFSVYVSLADDDYSEGLEYFRNINYSTANWDQKIKWYKSNSEYETGVNVSGSDKILIFQTCSMDNNYYGKYYRANLVVMAKLIEG